MAVTPADVAVTLGRPTPSEGSPEFAQWELWISYATRAIERRAERLHLTLANLNADDLDMVVRESVAAKIKNPDAVRRTEVAVDDGRVSKDHSSSSGQVTITDDWWSLLFPALGSSAWSTRPGFEPDRGVCWPGVL